MRQSITTRGQIKTHFEVAVVPAGAQSDHVRLEVQPGHVRRESVSPHPRLKLGDLSAGGCKSPSWLAVSGVIHSYQIPGQSAPRSCFAG